MKKSSLYRFWEILPGAITWLTLILPIALAWKYPKVVSIAVMLYALFWLFRTVYMSYHLILGFRHFRRAMEKHWLEDLKHEFPETWDKVYHLVFVPTYKESFETLDPNFSALADSDYPLENVWPVLCLEERAGEEAQEIGRKIKEKYGDKFGRFFVSTHPANIAGEVKGPGSNTTFAAKQIVPKLLEFGVDESAVVATRLDADSRVDKKYFSCLTKAYLECPDTKHASFQPLPMYFNNIWDVPMFIRLIALGSSFWVMVEATRADHLRNFSAHSQSLSGLVVSDYWSVTTIVEDGHQYWRSLYRFHGHHQVVPIFVPIYMDAVLTQSFWGTVREQYLQKRRWAWGVSDIPYVFEHNLADKDMGFIDKWYQFWRLFEGHYSWATASMILAFASWPPLLINEAYQKTVLAYNYPAIYSHILTTAAVGMIITLVISTLILPPPTKKSRYHGWKVVSNWILTPIMLPVTNILFSSIPAIESQTRLMFGKYLEFRVTVKKATPAQAPEPTEVKT